MPQYVIERNIPGVGASTAAQQKAGASQSCAALRELGPDIQWVQSYFTDDKIYCIYRASDAEIIRQHAKKAGVPADSVSAVRAVNDPTTAE